MYSKNWLDIILAPLLMLISGILFRSKPCGYGMHEENQKDDAELLWECKMNFETGDCEALNAVSKLKPWAVNIPFCGFELRLVGPVFEDTPSDKLVVLS
eukprot:CAMPEP_0184691752 /NCGR_PEP_ID=MMETSP0313-20130426/497_1 /TAXON_ID=2792 /ORGANISM="Porphyridium aerugineum, Strain SAG 1380-2" /LENGTH=98 /DNA_ID=CAMNT_0027149513 /DNA_START=451 /DNA_END=747 /DNA_ORIENTATION=+